MNCPMSKTPHLQAVAIVVGCFLLVGCHTGPPSGVGGLPRAQQDLTGLPYASQSFPTLMTQLDTNRDAAISKEELEQQLSQHFLAFDADGDAAVTREEFRSAEERDTMLQRQKQEYLDRTFRQLDMDNDGKLTKMELLAGAGERFSRMDVNRDARLTTDEYVKPSGPPQQDRGGWRDLGGFGGFGGQGRF